jgi:release factor glutamine methyltransferase
MRSDNVPEGSVGAVLEQATDALSACSDAARLEAEVLLAHALARNRALLRAHPEQCLSPQQRAHYLELVARRARGEPLAYVTGEREFWSLALRVGPEVLVPRPETELVVERCLALLAPEQACRVAELGTGSGAIAIALATERPQWRLTATDRSAAALRCARANAERLGAHNLEFLEGDWFEPLRSRRFHLIASNPPYVAAADPALQALRYEPSVALSPGPSGLEALRHLIDQSPRFLYRPGWLVLEHGVGQSAALSAALVAAGAVRVVCRRDLTGRDRVIEAQWL